MSYVSFLLFKKPIKSQRLEKLIAWKQRSILKKQRTACFVKDNNSPGNSGKTVIESVCCSNLSEVILFS